MLVGYAESEKECKKFIHIPCDERIFEPGFEWVINERFSKDEYLLEQALNALEEREYQIISVMNISHQHPMEFPAGQANSKKVGVYRIVTRQG